MRATGPEPDVRAIVEQRAGGYCERFGLPLRSGAHIHHRRPRGMGGSSSVDTNRASNLLWLHPSCHAKVESERGKALSSGFLVRQGEEPGDVPLFRWGWWVRLGDDGTVTPLNSHDDWLRQGDEPATA